MNTGTNSRQRIMLVVAAIVETMNESKNGEVIEGPMYAALMGQMNLQEFNGYVNLIVSSGLAARKGMHVLGITEKGRKLAAEIAKAKADHAAKIAG